MSASVLETLQHGVDGLQHGLLLVRRQRLDLFQPAQDFPAGLCSPPFGCFGFQKLVHADIQGLPKSDSHLCRQPQAVALVIGDERLQYTDPVGKLSLSEAAFLTEPRYPLADGFAAEVDWGEFQS